ncbi:hypothetical protein [Williamsia sp. 1135]|uniref:hypothetical protein n=1 Tax=Williamsia sp. 1135 TaxID=1889262 RepID=UPI000A11B60A|nr:hypothetical protein [Williamsia sp. 1135]ORM36114.1 hypothetical protein BFL43_08080 [Williamsia sp. 1135]
MPDRLKFPTLHSRIVWFGAAVLVVGVVIACVVAIPKVLHDDPCDTVLPVASELGLSLSDDDEVVACAWHSSFTDSSGTLTVRTASHATREALLRRSGVREEVERSMVSVNNGLFREHIRRPNLGRSRQVFVAAVPGGDQLTISYDEGVESGLVLEVSAFRA